MATRWFLIDYRYLSISVKVDWPNPELPVGPFTGYSFDFSIRPLFIMHIVSLWAAPFRCFQFAFLRTSIPDFTFRSDVLDTEESRIYPAGGYPVTLDLLHSLWRYFVFECRVHAIWSYRHVCHWYRLLVNSIRSIPVWSTSACRYIIRRYSHPSYRGGA